MRTLPSPFKKGYDGSRLKISMAILPLLLNDPPVSILRQTWSWF